MQVSEAVAALVDEMGAEVNVTLRPSSHPGPNGVQCVIVWDRKYKPEARPRAIVRAIMATQGLGREDTVTTWAYPKQLSTAPLRNQIEEWRESTLDRITELGAKYLLLIGRGAFELWRPELKMEQVEGKWGVMEGRWVCMVVKNPIAAVIDPSLQSEWRGDMVKFCEGVTRDYGVSELGDTCVEMKCGESVFMYDPDGLAWCKAHIEGGMRKRKNMIVARRKKANKREEGVLEL